MDIIDEYLIKLKRYMSEDELADLSLTQGAQPDEIDDLLEVYPDCPDSLIKLLSIVNGTYHEEINDNIISIYMLGSDVYEYPYYLKSISQILDDSEQEKSILDIYGAEFLKEAPDLINGEIDPIVPQGDRLCFADCMNDGTTSKLYIDFSPSEKGNVGQIVRYLHDDLDEYKVIAENFDDYLEYLIEEGFAFMLNYDG